MSQSPAAVIGQGLASVARLLVFTFRESGLFGGSFVVHLLPLRARYVHQLEVPFDHAHTEVVRLDRFSRSVEQLELQRNILLPSRTSRMSRPSGGKAVDTGLATMPLPVLPDGAGADIVGSVVAMPQASWRARRSCSRQR